MSKLITAIQNGKYPPLMNYNLSDDEVTMVAQLFNIKGLNSSVSLQREFLGCPAKTVVRDTGIHEFVDGRFIITKQYQTCKELSFKKQRGVVGLVSFPGSGNSWVRQLLETSTGVFTGSVYCDKSYVQAGMVGEGVRSEFVVAVKCHNYNRESFKKFTKLIYVIRSPFDAILAEFTRKAVHIDGTSTNASSKHVAELRSTDLSEVSDKWQEKVIRMKNEWLRHITTCLQSAEVPILVVKFENLKSNLFVEVKRMLDFLEVPYTDRDIECTINSNVESFHRQHHDKTFDPYSPQQKQSILDIIREANVILNQFDVNYDID
ncbi:WSCD family member CG9164-like [Dysidea avara]|uniref:WSCD family member CG9164-like n=1 Tax=Dysidea avara TaxID=196820 RepID=UPI00331E550B